MTIYRHGNIVLGPLLQYEQFQNVNITLQWLCLVLNITNWLTP